MAQAKLLSAVCAAGLVLAGCSATDDRAVGDSAVATVPAVADEGMPIGGPAPAIDGRTSWSGQQSAAFNDLFVTARDERGWRLMWQLVGEEPPGPLPDDAIAVGVFLGARPTAGYQVTVTQARETASDITVLYREVPPAAGATTAQILTSPYVIELLPQSTLPVNYDSAG